MVDAGDDDNSDVEALTGLTRQQIAEACGDEQVTKLHRSSRLAQPREIEVNVQSKPEELINDEEEIEFESYQENVVTTGYEQEVEGERMMTELGALTFLMELLSLYQLSSYMHV